MKKQIGMLVAMAALMAGGGAVVAQSAAPVSVSASSAAKVVPPVVLKKTVPGNRKIRDDANPYKYNRTPKSNQRQKRKFARQCPNQRSKQGLKRK
jgi:hypothetical protein